MQKTTLFTILLAFNVMAKDTMEDPFIWLEDVDAEKSMNWVYQHNQQTADQYKADPLYQELYDQALSTLNNQSRIPSVSQRGDWVYNYWKDDNNPRGIYRRAKLKDFNSKEDPDWQTVLDMDLYNEQHEGNWVYKGMSCLAPKYRKCLAYLSPGGGDAVEMHEFDMKKKTFVTDGFNLPKSKMRVTWRDEDHLYVGTDFGPGSMTKSGYPRIIKLWKRGTPLSAAETLMEVAPDSVSVFAYRSGEGDEARDFLIDSTSFWTNQYYQWVDGKALPFDLPQTAVVNGDFQGRMIVSLKEDWQFQGQFLNAGTVLMINPDVLTGQKSLVEATDWEIFLQPAANENIESIGTSDEAVLVNVLTDVVSEIRVYSPAEQGWTVSTVDFPDNGAIGITGIDGESGSFFAEYESFITPPTLYHVDGSKLTPKAVKSQSQSFDPSPYQVEQFFARSKDGTFVPYFIVMNKDTVFNGKNPTHIFSYGGFRNSLTPSYSGSYEALEGAYGKLWLDRGGVFVSANIRGGGAYGPKWHQSALLENRKKSFEDFEAVAEDLIKRKITSPDHLGIEGRSNGGLLVGATMTRRPDLYGAVICGVPLLDMKRYNKLLAGASWMGEYGNPDVPEQWAFIKEYSPYQNLAKQTDYPATFFYTSTRDDRVHPGHARKMAAKMMSYGYPVWYYENTEGGHGGSSTNEQLAERLALAYTHLWTHLR
ncbi:prolyl oligopeptidase family protein [Marinicella sediminis]|uniref:Prolyl oligopeptidase family protein n=1 Tax=Marinicella sediminis TaxID=1792834 RepID=A0ABV7JBI6_9GAMM|nr:prolyl oligopeptidase family serine peptidase [Marinicella sediminis]